MTREKVTYLVCTRRLKDLQEFAKFAEYGQKMAQPKAHDNSLTSQ